MKMPTIYIRKETHEKLRQIQSKLPFKPSISKIIAKLVEDYIKRQESENK